MTKQLIAILASLLIAGCQVSVEDKRLRAEDVIAAFNQRDQQIQELAKKIQELEKNQFSLSIALNKRRR